jgi:hypothetical protein
MTYQVVFDVSQRLPQLALGVAAATALAIVVLAGLIDTDALARRGPAVLGLGAMLLTMQWLVVGQWPFVVALLVVIGIVIALQRAGPAGLARSRAGARAMPGAGRLVIGLFELILAAFQGLPMVVAVDLTNRLAAGEAAIIEGPVTIQAIGKSECLVVEAQQFCYSDSVVTAGYNRRQYAFGSLQDGDIVRLSLIDGLIVRLEVRTGPDRPAGAS